MVLKISSLLGDNCMRRRYRFTCWVECMHTPREVVEEEVGDDDGVQGCWRQEKGGPCPHLREDLSEIMIPRDLDPLFV
jgi:hypothetical protein